MSIMKDALAASSFLGAFYSSDGFGKAEEKPVKADTGSLFFSSVAAEKTFNFLGAPPAS